MKPVRLYQRFLFSMIFGSVMTGCSVLLAAPAPTPTSAPTATFTPTPVFPLPEGLIIFEKPGGKKFSGTVHGQGETAIVLANMTTGGEAEWSPFVDAVDKQDFTTVTFNYLQPDYNGAAQETNIVLEKLRERAATNGSSASAPASE